MLPLNKLIYFQLNMSLSKIWTKLSISKFCFATSIAGLFYFSALFTDPPTALVILERRDILPEKLPYLHSVLIDAWAELAKLERPNNLTKWMQIKVTSYHYFAPRFNFTHSHVILIKCWKYIIWHFGNLDLKLGTFASLLKTPVAEAR